jgi:hypothetical protein
VIFKFWHTSLIDILRDWRRAFSLANNGITVIRHLWHI